MSDEREQDLIDNLYAVAMEPERFTELVDIWQERIDADPATAKLLTRHAERAETILSIMESNENMLPLPLREKLNGESQAMLALTADGVVEALNPAAQALFGIEEGVRISALPFTSHTVNIILKEIRRLTSRDNEDEQHTPTLFRMERKHNDKPLLVALSAWKTAGGRRFTLLKTADFIWPDYLSPLVKKAFGLTEAEADVVKYLVEGKNFEEIAQIRGTSPDTVRVQIRSIYAKTSTNSKSEFIRMAIGLTTLQLVEKDVLTGVLQRQADADSRAFPLPEHRRFLSLPDGRILDYAVFGPKDGKPCVFFHSIYFGDIWPAELAQYALQKGLRIIAPARPCYGRSSPYPKSVIAQEQFTDDLDALLRYLGIERAVHVSQTVGGMFSLEYANKFPQKVVAMVGVAPVLPIGGAEDIEKMPKFTKFIAKIVTRNPKMLKFVAKTGVIYHKRVGSLRFLENVVTQTEPDLKIIDDPKNVDAIIRGFEYSLSNGYLGIYHDYRHAKGGVWQQVLDVKCPIFAIIGTLDSNSRAARADRLIAEGANFRKIMAEGGGEMLFFSHPKLIVDTLVKAWREFS